MKTKIRRVKKALTKKALLSVGKYDNYWKWSSKLKELNLKGGTKSKSIFIYQQYKLWFNEEPPEGIADKLIELKIGYTILKNEIENKGKKLSNKCLKNYRAAMNLNLVDFDYDMRFCIKSAINQRELSPEQEEEMKVKRKKAVKKAQATRQAKTGTKKTKGETWAGILQENYKKKLNDTALAKEMTKRMGDGVKYNDSHVIKARGFFNFGALSSKVAKPNKPLQQY